MSSARKPKDIIANLSIPTLPEVVGRIQELMDDPKSGTREIGSLVEEDAPLAAKVLRVANSSFYGLMNTCTSTAQATTVLGVRVLRNIVAQVSVMQTFEHLEVKWGPSVGEIWRHATRAAKMSSFIADRARGMRLDAPECYACGLLHDIGKVVMLDTLGSEYMDTLMAVDAADRPSHVVEKEVFGLDHTEVGATVARTWGLPKVMANAIEHHHGTRDEILADPILCVIAAADAIVRAPEVPASPTVDPEIASRLGFEEKALAEIAQFAGTLYEASDDGGWHDDPW